MRGIWEVDRTSQWSRMTERPAITDLRGSKASDVSFTMSTANLVVGRAVAFRSDLFSSVSITLGSTVSLEESKRLVCLLLKWIGFD